MKGGTFPAPADTPSDRKIRQSLSLPFADGATGQREYDFPERNG